MLVFNIWFVSAIGIPDGYLGSAWAALAGYFAVMVISYFVGRHYYPLPYQTGRLALYTLLAALLYGAGICTELYFPAWLMYSTRVLLLAVYIGVISSFEHIPLLSRRR